jgi:uncharacterized protein YbaR (Trm112 family)
VKSVLTQRLVAMLRCPKTGGALTLSEDQQYLVSADNQWQYVVVDGVPALMAELAQLVNQ